MAPLKPGDKFPSDVVFDWVPIKNQDATLAGTPQDFNASSEWKGKRVVLVSVPGAFTPSCQAYHLPPYIDQLDKLKAKGVDQVAVIASNDGWVMSAWGKVNRVEGTDILFMGDTKSGFSKKHGWDAGMGDRNGRWAMVIDRDGTVKYADNEQDPTKVTVSGVEAVLSNL
ncbi:AhpC/TSA family protein-like protein [Paraphaeosphaeria sporulosa]|uniref:Thioredoxin peroxidase n=1 Tax=Paraphaeosphaeria sporulosa TaxID=1460663 RepID=A0A177CZR9_9PLEO|nr:AhpC/TSA family protein-like protein [Paraphaeosphaeria sporulosa]OAG12621.1 AhpC/TSA family protein-like protein [Paraphaeosphaeria sporulosa]